MIVGDFRLRHRIGEMALTKSGGDIQTGDWTAQGYCFFAGEGTYTKKIEIPSVESGKRILLDLNNVANACRVEIDGQTLGARISPPWTFDLTAFSGKCVNLSVKVINTPNNLFMDASLPAGLIGPAIILIET
jgi:hypothetical protein